MTRAQQVGIQTSIAVALSLLLTTYFNFYNAYWSIITIFVLSAAHAEESLRTAILRVFGTLLGVLIGFLIVKFAIQDKFIFYLSLFVVSFVGVYKSETSKHSYAWGLGCGTAFMMLIASSTSREAVYTTATLRSLEISIGCILAVVSAHLVFYKRQEDTSPEGERSSRSPNELLLHAIKIAISTWITFFIWHHTGWASATSGIVTAFIVSIQPHVDATLTKSLERFLGCAIGAVVGLLMAPFINSFIFLLIVMTVFSYAFTWLNMSYRKYRYVFVQAAAAFTIVLISPDNMFTTDIAPALQRLFGIFLGMTCAILVVNLLWPRRPVNPKETKKTIEPFTM